MSLLTDEPQVLPGLSDDGFLPMAKDGDTPLVLPGVRDDELDFDFGHDPMAESRLHLGTLDLDGAVAGSANGQGPLQDHQGWLF